ncbi:MAG: hypothetical protein ACOC05_08995 [Oceanicaulis sp.]
MRRSVLIRFAAALVALQALWSGFAATALAAGVDEARFFCGALAPSAEARAAMAELGAIAGLDEPAPETAFTPDDCPACTFAALPAADPFTPVRPAFTLSAASGAETGVHTVRQIRGPPVGLRAPPASV